MGINSFYTTAIQIPNGGASAGAGAQAGGTLGGPVTGTDTAGGALNFFDMFLARVQESLKAAQEKAQDAQSGQQPHVALTSENPLLEKDTKLDLARLLANNESISDQAKKMAQATEDGADAFAQNIAAAATSLALNEKSFEDVMKPIMESKASDEQKFDALQKLLRIETEKMDAEAKKDTPALLDIIFGLINAADTKNSSDAGALENVLALDNAAQLTSNMTPADITRLQESLRQKDMAAIADLLAKMDSAETAQKADAGESIAQALNAIDVGGDENTHIDTKANGFKNFETILKQFTDELRGMSSNTGNGDIAPAGRSDAPDNGNTSSRNGQGHDRAPAESAAPATAKNAALSMSAADTMNINEQFRQFIESMGLGAQSSYTSHATQSLINPVTQSAHAGAQHPATQAVMMTLQKSQGSGNESRNIMLELDPPELGRVEVRMNFGKDKSMKTSLLIEKPETYFLLQKDSHMLERTLQESGLDMDGGISFQLAGGDDNFLGDNRRGGGHDHGGQGAGKQAGAAETIETTMTWRIDPQTGHTRYDIWA